MSSQRGRTHVPATTTTRRAREIRLVDSVHRKLKWANTPIIYTDGSSKDGIAGGGVVCPSGPSLGATISASRFKILVGPGSSLKAELQALFHACKIAPPEANITIATDCLVGICSISIAIRDPLSIDGHTEEWSLRQCVDQLKLRTGRTHIMKVKAHIGIEGNEYADKTAEAARLQQFVPAPERPDFGGVSVQLYVSVDDYIAVRLQYTLPPPDDARFSILDPVNEATGSKSATAAALKAAFLVKTREEILSSGEDTIPSRWVNASISQELIPYSQYGFDKVRLGFLADRARNRGKIMQGARYHGAICPLPECSLKVNNQFHGRGPCTNPEQKDKITSWANKMVQATVKAARSGKLARWLFLVNAGTKDTPNGKEDWTVPAWMLPNKCGHSRGPPGNRIYPDGSKIPDKIDIMAITGLEPDTPAPKTHAEFKALQKKVVLVPVEVTSTHDFYLKSRRNGKRSKYSPLIRALQMAGWRVKLEDDTVEAPLEPWYMQYDYAEKDTTGPDAKFAVLDDFGPSHQNRPMSSEGERVARSDPFDAATAAPQRLPPHT